jgi:deoxyadenosine/deoxycytidine kinase
MHYLVIEGNIGSGKTSLAKAIADRYGHRLLLEEFAENTFLPQFYKDPERYAFPLEMSFLAARASQIKDYFIHASDSHLPVVSDYLFDKSKIFASVNLSSEEFSLYENFFKIIRASIPQPDLILFLDQDINTLKKNISERGRRFEDGISTNYLTNIRNAYKEYFSLAKPPNLMVIDTSKIDFVNNLSHLEDLLGKIMPVER